MDYKTNNKVFRLKHFKEIDSTNRFLREYDNPSEDIVVVYADYQTDGRGQRGNTWSSQQGENLLFSLLLHPTFLRADEQFRLSQIFALTIKQTLENYIHDVTVKWPNDLYWHDKKICGILIENDLQSAHVERSIVGAGVNINQVSFFGKPINPVSVKLITGKELDLKTVLHQVLDNFAIYYALLEQGKYDEIAETYHQSLYRKEGTYKYSDANGSFMATIHHVEPNGFLVLEDTDGNLRQYAFKEVVFE